MFIRHFYDLDTNHTYWNHNGLHQEFLENYIENKDFFETNATKTFIKKWEDTAYKYHRFFNDGDIPHGYKGWSLDMPARYLENKINMLIEEFQQKLNKKGVL